MPKKIDRTGEISFTRLGTEMKIIKYNNTDDLYVEFQDEYKAITHGKYRDFKTGYIKNPYDKSIEGIGYLGVGEYSRKTHLEIYNKWADMINRCYNPYTLNKKPCYIDVVVCEEWHNFQNFAKWYEENYYNYYEKLYLDKDILIKGNKIYSPETCIFVPHEINEIFSGINEIKGYRVIKGKYIAYIKVDKKQKHLGSFNSKEEAFNVYKIAKENQIKQLSDKYKPYIPQKLYDAMYNYKVEITD